MNQSDLTSGVYMITTDINEKFYIGSAIDLKDRFRRHIGTLKRNCHSNAHLQNTWNKHANCKFSFYILEYCETNKIIEREQFWIDKLKPEYNMVLFAYSWKGKTHSEETKKKLSLALKDIPHSLKRRKNQAQAQIGLKRLANKKLDKWPHENGNRCLCLECKQKKKEYLKNYWKSYERK